MDRIETDLLCILDDDLFSPAFALPVPGVALPGAFTGTFNDNVGRCRVGFPSAERGSLGRARVAFAEEGWLGRSSFHRSRALVGPRACSALAGVAGDAARWVVFVKVMLHLTSSPAKTVEFSHSTDISIFDIARRDSAAHTLRKNFLRLVKTWAMVRDVQCRRDIRAHC
jgi:hypothetical protein